jgi:hypothetical protein
MARQSGGSVTLEQGLSLLAATPSRLAELTAAVEPERLRTAPKPDDWSANDVLAHLRACADVWGGCIATMLTEEHPTIRAVNPTTWIDKTDYRDLEFAPSLAAFAAQRADLLAVLRSLPPDDWSRSANVTGAGKALQRTVLSYAQWLARHERSHIKQIERLVNAMRH